MSYTTKSFRWLRLLAMAGSLIGSVTYGQGPYGLDTRAPISPYLNNVMPPASGAGTFPSVLSATGAFSNLNTLTPATGLIPFTVNSPLWSDGAIKTRWIAVPNDGPPYATSEQISFQPTGEWSFPNGTVFVKHFELTVNEITGEKKRLETRFLVRDQDGAVYGVTYKWRPDNSDADLLPGPPLDEDITITTSTGATRIQKWSYPGRGQCLTCHNAAANYVLGVKTHQLNGNIFYPTTGRTDNQLRTFAHVGMLNPTPNESDIPNFLKSVPLTNTSVPVQTRMRSWIDSNCSQCHRPGGIGPGYDARFYTAYENQDIATFMRFRDVQNSDLYLRDSALDASKMPPLAKNVVDETAMALLRQWIASPLEVLSVYLYQDTSHVAVRFNSHVNPDTAAVALNYQITGVTISGAVMGPQPDTVILTVSPLVPTQTYYLTPNNIQDTAPSANTIWLGIEIPFVAQYMPTPTGSRLGNIATRLQVGLGDDVLIAGFITRGTPDKRIMIRAIGPSLSGLGIPNPVADPVLELYDQTGTLIATNDNWVDNANEQEIIDTTIAPTSENESVILKKLPSDDNGIAYTAVLRGGGSTPTGVGLLEVYDLDGGLGPKVLNISTRGRVDTGDNVMIGGIIITGQSAQRVIARAIGPSLPVAGKLEDPTLELHDSNGGLLASNDNWRTDHEQEIIATGIPPSNDLEPAIVATLPPANYTAVVRGAGNTTGVALVEVYALY